MQARTCPVCRTDIPSSISNLDNSSEAQAQPASAANPLQRAFRREDFHQEVVNILHILRRQEDRLRQANATEDGEDDDVADEGSGMRPANRSETEIAAIEEGRAIARQHSS